MWYLSGFLWNRFRPDRIEKLDTSIIQIINYLVRVLPATAFIISYLLYFKIITIDLLTSVSVASTVVGLVVSAQVVTALRGWRILRDRPYRIDDMVYLNDHDRIYLVDDISLRNTKLYSFDNEFVVIPNRRMAKYDITNLSNRQAKIRRSFSVSVKYENDINTAVQLVKEAMDDTAKTEDDIISSQEDIHIRNVEFDGEPKCRISEFAANGIVLSCSYWVRVPCKLQRIESILKKSIWEVINDSTEVGFPYPHTHQIFDEDSGTLNVNIREESPSGR